MSMLCSQLLLFFCCPQVTQKIICNFRCMIPLKFCACFEQTSYLCKDIFKRMWHECIINGETVTLIHHTSAFLLRWQLSYLNGSSDSHVPCGVFMSLYGDRKWGDMKRGSPSGLEPRTLRYPCYFWPLSVGGFSWCGGLSSFFLFPSQPTKKAFFFQYFLYSIVLVSIFFVFVSLFAAVFWSNLWHKNSLRG